MSYKLFTYDHMCSWDVLELEIPGLSEFAGTTIIYVGNDRIDSVAKMMSVQFPDRRICINTHARVKAAYVNGKRVALTDLRDFYTNLTDEEYEATKILDETTHKWI